MKSSFVVAGFLSGFVASGAFADLMYSQSFENTDWLGSKYYDTQDVATDHWLFNNPGESAVNGDGFNAYYISTGGVGLGDGDFFGVTDYTGGGISGAGGYYDGNQGYQMSDVDGIVELHFDGYEGIADLVTLAIFVADTGFENSSPNVDFLSFHYGDDDILAYYDDDDLEAMGDGGSWIYLEFTPDTSGHFHIAFSSNAGTEVVTIDAVNIYGTVIPAPGAIVLLGLAGLASRRRRK